MKRVFSYLCPLVFALSIAVSCGTAEQKNKENDVIYDYELYGLNRPVKMVKVRTYEAMSKFGDVVKGELTEGYNMSFNSVGNIEVWEDYDSYGDLDYVRKYKYNDNNLLVEKASYFRDGELFRLYKNEYDKDNNCIKTVTYSGDGALLYYSTHEYEDGNLIRTVNKDYYDEEEHCLVYINKWNGDKLVETVCEYDGEYNSLVKYTHYDKKHYECVEYDKNGEITAEGSLLLNDLGRLVKESYNDVYREVKWNEKNLPVYLYNVNLYNNTNISYPYGDDIPVYYVEYKYDKIGNWIEQIVYEGKIKKPVSISEREIIY